MHHDMILALFGALLAASMMGCGYLIGRRETLKTINDQVALLKARLQVEREDVTRITEGIRQGWLDSAGQAIKLLTASKLRSLTDEELEGIAKDRGILTMQRLGDRDALITAIESQQRHWLLTKRVAADGMLVGDNYYDRGSIDKSMIGSGMDRRAMIDNGLVDE